MKNKISLLQAFLVLCLLCSPLLMQGQDGGNPDPDAGCNDLFISEILFNKEPGVNNIAELNYAVEIFNASGTDINLAIYDLQLQNNILGQVTIPLSGILSSHEVYVVSNSNARVDLQQISDQLNAGLDFGDKLSLELRKNSVVIDKVGEGIPNTPNTVLDINQMLLDPVSYLASFDLNLDDYNNIDVRRGLFVIEGEPNFTTEGILGNWSYHLSSDISDIGEHKCMCNKPEGQDYIGFEESSFIFYLGDEGQVDPMQLIINGQSGSNQPINNASITIDYLHSGPTDVCYSTVANPNPELEWNGAQSTTQCNDNIGNPYGVFTTIPKIKRTFNPIVNNPSYASITLSSTDPNVQIDLSRISHTITLLPIFPMSTQRYSKVERKIIYPNVTVGNLFVHAKEKYSYKIFNTLGRVVLEGSISERDKYIETSNFANGIYLVSFSSDNGYFFLNKFIKQ